MLFSQKNSPRWLIFLIDLGICTVSIVLAYLLRFEFSIPAKVMQSIPLVVFYLLCVRAISFVISRVYAGIVRYTSTDDAARIVVVLSLGSIFFVVLNLIRFYFIDGVHFIPYSILIFEFIGTTFLMVGLRILVKITYLEYNSPSKLKSNVIIYGAGEAGMNTYNVLQRNDGIDYKVLAFIDDDKGKMGKKIDGIGIYHFDKMGSLLKDNQISQVILSIQNLGSTRKKEIIEECLNYDVKVLSVPPVKSWINGELSYKQIKHIRIEDLLEREEIRLNEKKVRKDLYKKNVLVTGAAGSIGSEIIRQIARFSPKSIIMLDQAETPLHELELELFETHRHANYEAVIGDIRNRSRMENVFKSFKPDIIFHAAAYKHVPMMENNPSEAVLSNIAGTKTIADLALEFKVAKFVMVSTDKAVNPTNVMGASKRIAEIYTQSLNGKDATRFITTRFGNVLGSNGSVVRLFKKQIDRGGPLTITHPEITRYFMTIPEACQLVLEAGAMGNGGEIFIFDMGKSVKIVDLAKKMVKLSGLALGKDIRIDYTGLRPGEKLYEELLNDKENTISTHNSRIMIAKVKEYNYDNVLSDVNELIGVFDGQNNHAIVKKMKQIVPEFKSKNSIYEELDD